MANGILTLSPVNCSLNPTQRRHECNRVILILAFASLWLAFMHGLAALDVWVLAQRGGDGAVAPGLATSELVDTLSKQLPNDGRVDHLTMRDWTARLKPGRYTFPHTRP